MPNKVMWDLIPPFAMTWSVIALRILLCGHQRLAKRMQEVKE